MRNGMVALVLPGVYGWALGTIEVDTDLLLRRDTAGPAGVHLLRHLPLRDRRALLDHPRAGRSGGIGTPLLVFTLGRQWETVGVILIVIVITVAIIDNISTYVRSKIV